MVFIKTHQANIKNAFKKFKGVLNIVLECEEEKRNCKLLMFKSLRLCDSFSHDFFDT